MSATLYTSLGIGNDGAARTLADRTVVVNVATRGLTGQPDDATGTIAVAQSPGGNPLGTELCAVPQAIALPN
ncbi:hypothetical protein [Paludibacterium paludis]|uniref:Uncharacterized protein n=1 Tax=Paludibacterium paludis TaxID=1225769 RepID=A0A918P466_9NEIS|nr:hypothetical protein [Paludibacterium paludis]GGY20203.1 hypothetical protein GCM10011289_24670 [Paludibacterium paludis]